MSPKLSQSQVQKQILAPSMQQSIEILLLPLMDLHTAIEQELQENPLLEVNEDMSSDSMQNSEDYIKEQMERLQHIPAHASGQPIGDDQFDDRPIHRIETLEEQLNQQLRIELSDELEIKIGESIIGNINDDGYLSISCEDIAHMLEITDIALIEKVIKRIQTFEPIGIASRDLKECLGVQILDRLGDDDNLAYKITQRHLKELGMKKIADIAKKLNASLDEIKEAVRFISSLDPKPARNFRPIDANIYIKPDVYIIEAANGYHIQLNNDGVPSLQINAVYQNLLKQGKLVPQEREFIREKLRNGLLFIKSIEQRGQTVKEIAQQILDKQKDFFENGHHFLAPMTLKDVAQILNRNESTISRAVNNKYIDTPQGVFPMKFFFSQAVGTLAQDVSGMDQRVPISNRSIKEEIKDLVKMENKSSPLSDQEIQNHFENQGMKIARRTISKYRQTLHILPSHLRRE